MKNWNLRTIVLVRSLTMVVMPLWFLIYRSGLPGALGWILLWGAVTFAFHRLDDAAKAQMDECAQALLDKLGRHVEYLVYFLAVMVILLLTQVSRAPDPAAMTLAAAQVLAWGMFAIHLYRGIAFWVLDRKGA